MTEHKIDEKVKIGNKLFIVKQGTSKVLATCKICDMTLGCEQVVCTANRRSDKKNVYYEEVRK